MVTSLAPGASSSLTSPVLLAYCSAVQGAGLFLADPFALSFAIDDLHDPLVAAAQIYPAPVGAITASVERSAGPFVLADGMTLLVSLDDGPTQTLALTAVAFAAIGGTITSAPAWQVTTVINDLVDIGKIGTKVKACQRWRIFLHPIVIPASRAHRQEES